MIITNRPASTLPPVLRMALRGGLVASLALGLVYCSEQTSPTAAELPAADLTDAKGPVVELQPADTQADEGSWSWYVAGGPADLPLVILSGSAPLPTQGEQAELLAAIAELPELPEGSQGYRFFYARRTSDVAYGDVSEIVDVASGEYDNISFRSLSPGLEVTMTAGPRPPGGTDR